MLITERAALSHLLLTLASRWHFLRKLFMIVFKLILIVLFVIKLPILWRGVGGEALRTWGLIHLQQLVHVFPGVAQAWHLVLATEFALGFQPLLEKVGMGLDDFEVLERDVVEAFRLVV